MPRKSSILLICPCLVFVTNAVADPLARSAALQAFAQQARPAKIERFLASGQIVHRTQVAGPGNGTYRAVLSDGDERKTALVETITPYEYMGFRVREDFAHNAVAYRLDRLLDANVVNATVVRRVAGKWASVTISSTPTSFVAGDADNRAAVFRALAASRSGSFSGAFGETKELVGLEEPVAIDERFRASLASLDRTRLKEEFGGLLTGRQIRCLLARRDRILRLSRTGSTGSPVSLVGSASN